MEQIKIIKEALEDYKNICEIKDYKIFVNKALEALKALEQLEKDHIRGVKKMVLKPLDELPYGEEHTQGDKSRCPTCVNSEGDDLLKELEQVLDNSGNGYSGSAKSEQLLERCRDFLSQVKQPSANEDLIKEIEDKVIDWKYDDETGEDGTLLPDSVFKKIYFALSQVKPSVQTTIRNVLSEHLVNGDIDIISINIKDLAINIEKALTTNGTKYE
jgi:hypothetical protein